MYSQLATIVVLFDSLAGTAEAMRVKTARPKKTAAMVAMRMTHYLTDPAT